MNRILVAVDFSPHSARVVQTATDLARRLDTELCILHMAAPDPDFVGLAAGPQSVRDSRAGELRDEHKTLHEHADAARDAGVDAKALLVQGPTVDGIIDEAQKLGADFIVVGSHARGPISRAILGSVSEAVLRRATCPVLVVPDSTD